MLVLLLLRRQLVHDWMSKVISMHPSQEVAVADQLPPFASLRAIVLSLVDGLSNDERRYAAAKDDDLVSRFHPSRSKAEIALVGLESVPMFCASQYFIMILGRGRNVSTTNKYVQTVYAGEDFRPWNVRVWRR
jgi:hypothetical protein